MIIFKKIKDYISLVKFSHTIFALPFAAIGFVLGVQKSQSQPDVFLIIKVLICMVTARNAAMAFNRWADRKFDALNPRTALREIPAGIINADQALIFVILNAFVFMITAYKINLLCFYLSPLALLIILGYSYTKRFTPLCHLVLGIGLALAPVGAYLAVTGIFDSAPVVLGLAVLCWVSGFDIIYALQDDQFDKENRLYSIPSSYGRIKALHISEVLHVLCGLLIFIFTYLINYNYLNIMGMVIFCSLLIYQHRIVKPNDLSKVNMAFATTNGLASIVFATFIISGQILKL
jgi:4-hydroxybenzoate polyprenyltransferase